MKEAKRIVGKNCCISGGFDGRILETGTPQQVTEAVKRILDICAPGAVISSMSIQPLIMG